MVGDRSRRRACIELQIDSDSKHSRAGKLSPIYLSGHVTFGALGNLSSDADSFQPSTHIATACCTPNLPGQCVVYPKGLFAMTVGIQAVNLTYSAVHGLYTRLVRAVHMGPGVVAVGQAVKWNQNLRLHIMANVKDIPSSSSILPNPEASTAEVVMDSHGCCRRMPRLRGACLGSLVTVE